MLDTRAINEGVDKRREALMQEYLKLQNTPMRFRTLDDFDADPVDVKRWTEPDNVRAWRDFFLEHESDFKR